MSARRVPNRRPGQAVPECPGSVPVRVPDVSRMSVAYVPDRVPDQFGTHPPTDRLVCPECEPSEKRESPQSVHIARNLASGSRCQPARGEPPVPPVDAAESCVCAPCRAFADAIDRHTAALGRGRGDSTRNAVRLAAHAVDTAHGLAKAPA
jgi:hypothetical protein